MRKKIIALRGEGGAMSLSKKCKPRTPTPVRKKVSFHGESFFAGIVVKKHPAEHDTGIVVVKKHPAEW